MTEDLTEFWKTRWQSALDASPLRRRRKTGAAGMKRWNKMAPGFARRTQDESAEENRVKILQWLTEKKAVFPGAKVLDIGAGPGNWSLPLAEAGAQVTALEPSDGMVDILKERIKEKNVAGVLVDQRTWQDVDLEKDGWHQAFDLVFASMTPGIDGPENLARMMAASRKFCYLSAFSGMGWRQWYGDLWKELFDESLDGHPNDIIHPFNLVYAMGYRPDLRFHFWERERAMPKEEAVEDFITHMEGFFDETDDIREKIAAYVEKRCENGMFTLKRNGCQGMMVWSMDRKVPGA